MILAALPPIIVVGYSVAGALVVMALILAIHETDHRRK